MRFLPVAALVAIVWWTPPMRLNLKAICAIHISHSRPKVSLKMAISGGFFQKSAATTARITWPRFSTMAERSNVSLAFEELAKKRGTQAGCFLGFQLPDFMAVSASSVQKS